MVPMIFMMFILFGSCAYAADGERASILDERADREKADAFYHIMTGRKRHGDNSDAHLIDQSGQLGLPRVLQDWVMVY